MKRVLILFATREGQTNKIANRISTHLEHAGLSTHVVDAQDSLATEKLDLDAYDLLVFGASMHAGGLESELVHFVNRNAERIQLKAKSLFLVLLSAATREPSLRESSLADAQRKMDKQLALKFDDTEMIAGALVYSKYPRPIKWIMQRIAKKAGEDTDTSRDYEYTDWQQVERYAHRLIKK